jgi:type VI secretion system secreted protein Hcp
MDGESQDSKHKGWIDILSFSWGATNVGTSHVGGGSGAGKVNMQDFHFRMHVNKASPKLVLACAKGQHIKSAILVCRKAGGEQQEYLKYTFSDLLVSSFSATGASGAFTSSGGSPAGLDQSPVPSEEITLNYSKLEYEYHEQMPDGTLGGAVKTSCDVKGMVFS